MHAGLLACYVAIKRGSGVVPCFSANYTAWMDLDEITLEDLDSRMLLQPAAMPTEPPIILTRERHELQPVYVYMYSSGRHQLLGTVLLKRSRNQCSRGCGAGLVSWGHYLVYTATCFVGEPVFDACSFPQAHFGLCAFKCCH